METTHLEWVSDSEDRRYSPGLNHKVYREMWTPETTG